MWWRCRILPPGPIGLLRWPFIAIANLAGGRSYIIGPRVDLKRPWIRLRGIRLPGDESWQSFLYWGHAAISRPSAPRPPGGHPEERPDRDGDAVGVRPPDALRAGRRFPPGDHQEAACPLDRPRAPVVPARRHQRRLSA